MAKCRAEFTSSDPKQPDLSCDKSSRPHVAHHDPAANVKYTPMGVSIFCLCGIRKHKMGCPLGD